MEGFDKLRRLDENDVLPVFDCGDEDLNRFIADDAKPYQKQLLAVTYYEKIKSEMVLYFSLSNDKISNLEYTNRFWRKVKSLFPHSKHRKDYPAVKIGRFAISNKYQHSGLGSDILNYIKLWMVNGNKTGCRFIIVDAYKDAVPFYLRNGFRFMDIEEEQGYNKPSVNTVSMYYDLMNITQ